MNMKYLIIAELAIITALALWVPGNVEIVGGPDPMLRDPYSYLMYKQIVENMERDTMNISAFIKESSH